MRQKALGGFLLSAAMCSRLHNSSVTLLACCILLPPSNPLKSPLSPTPSLDAPTSGQAVPCIGRSFRLHQHQHSHMVLASVCVTCPHACLGQLQCAGVQQALCDWASPLVQARHVPARCLSLAQAAPST